MTRGYEEPFDAEGRPVSRRDLLRRAGAGALAFGVFPAALAACGGDGGGAGAAASGSGSAGAPSASGRLDYYGWEGEDFKSATDAFRKESGLQLKVEAMASIDDGIAKLQGGSGGGIDLLGTSGVAVPRIAVADVLLPLDEQKIPNLAKIAGPFSKEPPGPEQSSQVFGADGRRLVVPTYFGTQGLTYDTEAVGQAPRSWHDVLEPQFKGRVGFYNDPGVQFTSVAWALGMNPGKVPKARLGEVVEFTDRLLDQVKGISASVGDLVSAMVSGDVAVAFTGYPAIDIFGSAAGKTTLKTTFDLEEGGWSYMEVMGIPKDADNPDAAYAYINGLLDPKINAPAVESVGGATVVTGAPELLSKQARALYPYDTLEAFLERAPLLPFAPLESGEYVTQAEWAEKWTALTS